MVRSGLVTEEIAPKNACPPLNIKTVYLSEGYFQSFEMKRLNSSYRILVSDSTFRLVKNGIFLEFPVVFVYLSLKVI